MDWVAEVIGQYGYGAIFLLLAIGIVGIPIPDEIMMVTIGYLSSLHVLSYPLSVLFGFLGTITGMTVSFWIGRRFGKPLLLRFGKYLLLTPKKLEKAEKLFERYVGWTIIFGYYIPGIRHLTCYVSGISGINFRKYFIVSSVGGFIWCLIFVTIGYVAGGAI
ncbi:membrane protein DedA with SNARE-associated domain [Paenibacillus rhizosphaerae]|uniref:Membrane protein DedA with SNARE-associated domain n=1 Tax=Paenibacillus rhizosphaerae TaxID=297318 RepID=A0A839TWU7_9BACL|nr:DedA family protein [Paenibacillus rhizosphaerae]MBB3131326.1 membrane protein DedA with SNARE-associated domain [Paenibacillus rhizosphaerae]